jgi:serine/threonine protein kinase
MTDKNENKSTVNQRGKGSAKASKNIADSDTLVAATTGEDYSAPEVRVGGGGVAKPNTPSESPTAKAPGEKRAKTPWIGRTISDRYTILEELGKGGMSEVFVARHNLLHKTVAIKVLKDELATDRSALERFHREAVAAANIGDAHIVDVTDYGFTKEGDAYIVMEHLKGRDLRHLIFSETALSAERAVRIARQVLKALVAAHAQGIIHRDLKAENVYITERDGKDFIKLLDFGISKVLAPILAGGESLTMTGAVMGTPQCISPEQAQADRPIDHRVDIYAMGVILYEMLTGQLPFTAQTALALLMKHVHEEPDSLRDRRPDLNIPAELEAIALRALRKDPDERFATAEDMLGALSRTAAATSVYPSLTRLAKTPALETVSALTPASRSYWPLLIGGIGLALVVSWFGFWRGDGPPSFSGNFGDAVNQDASAIANKKRPDAASGLLQKTQGKLPPDLAPTAPVSPVDANIAQIARDASLHDLAHSATDANTRRAEQVTVTVKVTPKTGEIIAAGRKSIGISRLQRAIGQRLSVEIKAAGHRSEHRQLLFDRDRTVRIKLKKTGKQGDLLNNPYAK